VEKYGRARESIADNIIGRMRFARWITKATNTHAEYVMFIAFLLQNGYANATKYCVVLTGCVCIDISPRLGFELMDTLLKATIVIKS